VHAHHRLRRDDVHEVVLQPQLRMLTEMSVSCSSTCQCAGRVPGSQRFRVRGRATATDRDARRTVHDDKAAISGGLESIAGRTARRVRCECPPGCRLGRGDRTQFAADELPAAGGVPWAAATPDPLAPIRPRIPAAEPARTPRPAPPSRATWGCACPPRRSPIPTPSPRSSASPAATSASSSVC
jgi:hypothetical protein